jgi:hypothetical protein
VTGYIWVAGQWQWNGYEWLWVSGHYAIDPNFQDYQADSSYDPSYDPSYDDGVRY